jgi:hypothetical protein
MPVIDPTLTYKHIGERLEKTTNPKHRQMLERLYQHARCETESDLEGVMATLGANPSYKVWSMPGAATNPTGTEAVRNFYVNQIFGKGRHCLESIKDRIVVDDNCIVTESDVRTVRWGRDLIEEGIQVDEADACYVQSYRMLIVWPYDETNHITGEESWSTRAGGPVIDKVPESEVPEDFKAYLAKRRSELKS